MSSSERVFARRWAWGRALLAVLALVATACATDDEESVVLVFAAASLAEAFTELESDFEAAHPEVDVRLNLAGSTTLREQILAGAPADVYAAADPIHVEVLAEAGAITESPRVLARNRMAIGVPPGNPAQVSGLSDFADEGLVVGLCAASVPCGRLARSVLDRAGVDPAPDTEEPDVRALVTKLGAGELDAGIVYLSDIVSGTGAIEGMDIADGFNVETDYPIVRIQFGPNQGRAQEFIDFVLSHDGQATLARHGFETP